MTTPLQEDGVRARGSLVGDGAATLDQPDSFGWRPMHAAETSVQLGVTRKSRRVTEVVFWLAGFVFAFVVPLVIVLGAILVSSYGIPLPIEVRIP
jgi:hypothetical protein